MVRDRNAAKYKSWLIQADELFLIIRGGDGKETLIKTKSVQSIAEIPPFLAEVETDRVETKKVEKEVNNEKPVWENVSDGWECGFL